MADRPRRRAVHPPHLARPRRACAPAVRADPRPRAAAVRRVDRRGADERHAPRIDARLLTALVDATARRVAARRPVGRRRRPRQRRRTSATCCAGSRRRARSSRRRTVPAPRRSPFQYAIVRVVPRVERGECLNVGVVLLCRPRRFLGARIAARRGAAGGLRARPRPGDDPAAPRRDRADRRRRPDGRTDRPARRRRSGSTGWSPRRARSSSRPRSTPGCATTPTAELDHLVATLVALTAQRPDLRRRASSTGCPRVGAASEARPISFGGPSAAPRHCAADPVGERIVARRDPRDRPGRRGGRSRPRPDGPSKADASGDARRRSRFDGAEARRPYRRRGIAGECTCRASS